MIYNINIPLNFWKRLDFSLPLCSTKQNIMGHFFFPCRLSNTAIPDNVECYIIPLKKGTNTPWEICSLPSVVTMDIYGRVETIIKKNGYIPEDTILMNCILINKQVLDSCVKSEKQSRYDKNHYSNLFSDFEAKLSKNLENLKKIKENSSFIDSLIEKHILTVGLTEFEFMLKQGEIKFIDSNNREFIDVYLEYDMDTRAFFWETFVPMLNVLRYLNINIQPYGYRDSLQESWIYELAPVLSTLMTETIKVIDHQKKIWDLE